MTSPDDTLQQIQDRLANTPPAEIVEQMLPVTPPDAMTWARRLPLWDDFQGQFSGQAVALARVISRRAMKEFGLVFDAEGRVVPEEPRAARKESPGSTFPLQIGEQTVKVEYKPHYLPNSGQDLFSFIGEPVSPPPDSGTIASVIRAYKAHPLSDTGWLSHGAQHDAVEACGGPQKYATLYVEARLRGKEEEFTAAFKGKPRWETKAPRRKQPAAAAPVIGEHTAAVAEEQRGEEPPRKPEQKELFP